MKRRHFWPEHRIADRERLVDQQNIGLGVRADREREARAHPARIEPHRLIDERTDAGELANLGEPPQDLGAAQAEHRPGNQHVVATGDVADKAGAKRQDRRDPAVDLKLAAGRPGDAGEQLQERGLARAIMANETDALAAGDFEVEVAQHPVLLIEAAEAAKGDLLQPIGAPGVKLIGLAEPGAADRDVR